MVCIFKVLVHNCKVPCPWAEHSSGKGMCEGTVVYTVAHRMIDSGQGLYNCQSFSLSHFPPSKPYLQNFPRRTKDPDIAPSSRLDLDVPMTSCGSSGHHWGQQSLPEYSYHPWTKHSKRESVKNTQFICRPHLLKLYILLPSSLNFFPNVTFE